MRFAEWVRLAFRSPMRGWKRLVGSCDIIKAPRARYLGHDFHPMMIVVDSARDKAERMTPASVWAVRELSRGLGVEWRYIISPDENQVDRPPLASS